VPRRLSSRRSQTIRQAARRSALALSEWARQAIRHARRTAIDREHPRKLAVIRAAASHSFTTSDIDQMLTQIESGYREAV
jgi:hypothetical protein